MAKMKTMDGNEAAAYASYAFTEIAAIYPITPSSPMADHVDTWAASGMKNIFGQPVKLVEMQSEAGAVSAMHGALDSGSLGTSYTASQGMMLMIPTMYRIAGELKPAVIHAASRNVATNNISIFAEHSDVMACRQTGFALLASSNVQECMDIGAVAHLSAIKGHVPFLHFFDGFRTSHEIQKIDVLDFNDLAKLVDYEELEKFRKRSLNPERPLLRTAGLNADTYFQCREAMNPYYDALPEIVEEYMGKMSELTGREYHCVNYYGGHDWQQGAVVVQPSGVLAGQREWTCRRCGRNGYTYIDPPIRAYEQFYDVDPNRWSYDGISYCVKTGAMSGTGTHTFAPYGVTTRAQIVQILYELSGAPAVSGGTPFRDLTQSWYRKAVVWAYQNDVVSGTSGTTFAPEAPVTREQIGCIMMNYFFNVLKLKQQWALADLSEYPDGDQVSPWARASMQHAMSMIISGAEINGVVYIDPQGDATREQVATIVAEFCQWAFSVNGHDLYHQ